MNNKVFCVISHTHWDREWYMPFEQFRFRLVDLIDNLLEILDENKQYIFHLDAQTIVLEDYLEIRPYRKEILQRYIKEGRLLVGPWYVQNDFYLTSGEATIRNLLIGSRIANEMGKCTWVGYTPDQFGLISQLPQIFNSFGMDSCIFGRGYNFYEKQGNELKALKLPSEFTWKGEDGSSVLAVNMPFWYNNAQRFFEDINKSLKLLEMIENNFEGIALTPYLLLMNGVDHLEAQENLIPILEKLNKALKDQKTIVQMPMNAYLDHIKQSLPSASEYLGELRNGMDNQILQGTLSSRSYLKAENVRTQTLLENELEPIYSFISMLGAEERYPTDFMNYLWKQLLQNHPHDSICGCSRDEVHRHMEDRYQRIHEAGQELLNRGMDFLAAHMDRSKMSEKDYLITLCNTVETTRDAVIDLELDFPVEEAVSGFRILDAKEREIPFAVTARWQKDRDMFSAINLPGTKKVDAYKVTLYVKDFEGMSLQTLTVKTSNTESDMHVFASGAQALLPVKLENEYITVLINENGTIDLIYRETGRQYNNVLSLEDCEDCGDSYIYLQAEKGRTYTSEGLTPEVKCIVSTPFEAKYSLTYPMQLPEGFEEETGQRSEKLVTNRIEVILGLKKGSRWLDIDFNVDNRSKNHRLRALLKTGMNSDFTYASVPFDVIERDRKDVLKGVKNGSEPNSSFVDIGDGSEGLAVLNQGMHEYEHLLGEDGIIAMTLLRANGMIEIHSKGETWQVPENQCLRSISLKMALYPHKGDFIKAQVSARSKEFLTPVLHCFQPQDIRKFTGGRPAVQDTTINETFYREKTNADLIIPHALQLFHIEGKGVIVSAVKKCENSDGIVIRLYNSSSIESGFKLTYFKQLVQAEKVNMHESAVSELLFNENELETVLLKPKEIFTMRIR